MIKFLLWCILLVVFWPLALVIAICYGVYLCLFAVVWLYMAAFRGTYLTAKGLSDLAVWSGRRQQGEPIQHFTRGPGQEVQYKPGQPRPPENWTGAAYDLDELNRMLGRKK